MDISSKFMENSPSNLPTILFCKTISSADIAWALSTVSQYNGNGLKVVTNPSVDINNNYTCQIEVYGNSFVTDCTCRHFVNQYYLNTP